jgi:hypothetical protein
VRLRPSWVFADERLGRSLAIPVSTGLDALKE